MSVSESVKDAIHAGLFDIFSNNLEISTTTGYDWTQTSEVTKSEQTTVKIEAEAPPGGFFISRKKSITSLHNQFLNHIYYRYYFGH